MSASIAIERVETHPIRRFFALDPLDNRYPALHGMRVLAILFVVQYHVTAFFVRTAELTLASGERVALGQTKVLITVE
jgi:hypothetical protein